MEDSGILLGEKSGAGQREKLDSLEMLSMVVVADGCTCNLVIFYSQNFCYKHYECCEDKSYAKTFST